MIATIGMQLRLEPAIVAAIDAIVPRGGKTQYIRALILRDLRQRHRRRPKDEPKDRDVNAKGRR